MKRIAAIALVAVATLIMAGSALAQDHLVKANVPFNFSVRNSPLPAGTYTIGSGGSMSNVIDIASREHGVHILAIAMTDPNGTAGSGMLIFHQYGDKYFLSEIRYPDSSANVHFVVTEAEKRARSRAEEARLRVNDNVTIALNTAPAR